MLCFARIDPKAVSGARECEHRPPGARPTKVLWVKGHSPSRWGTHLRARPPTRRAARPLPRPSCFVVSKSCAKTERAGKNEQWLSRHTFFSPPRLRSLLPFSATRGGPWLYHHAPPHQPKPKNSKKYPYRQSWENGIEIQQKKMSKFIRENIRVKKCCTITCTSIFIRVWTGAELRKAPAGDLVRSRSALSRISFAFGPTHSPFYHRAG